MMGLRQSLLPVLVTLMMVGMPVAALAGDRQDDHDRGGNRHQLIDHKKIKEIKEHNYGHQGGPDGSLVALQALVADLQGKLAGLTGNDASLVTQLTAAQTQISALLARVQVLEANGGGGGGGTIPENLTKLSQYLTVDTKTINGVTGPHVIFTGVNVHIRSGSGLTDANVNGLGNLVVGYNEVKPGLEGLRGGSHNIVGGFNNSFPSLGGLVVGQQNTISGKFATVTGGYNNEASGQLSSILGGQGGLTDGSTEHIP